MPATFESGLKKRLTRGLAIVEPLSVVLALVYLLAKSWLRWSDPLVDFPRDLYFAWRINQGDLLYVQLADWYGPLSNLIQALGFRLFGVGLDTIIWMNIALTVGVVLLLRGIFGALGNRLMVWLASMVFVLVYAVGSLSLATNFNFITPYVAQFTYGFAGLLLMLWALLRHLQSNRPVWLGVAGLGLAVAYLDKPEPLLAAGGALGVYLVARFIQSARAMSPGSERPPQSAAWLRGVRWLGHTMLWLAGGFLSLWLSVFIYFYVKGGPVYAFHAADYVPYSVLASSMRHTVEHTSYNQHLSGFDQPLGNFFTELCGGTLLVQIFATMAGAAWAWSRSRKFSAAWWIWPLVMVNAGVIGLWLSIRHRQIIAGHGITFPVGIASAAAVGWCGLAAWRRQAGFSRALGLAVVGVAASLMLARMILNTTLYESGAFMTPLAVLFIIHLVVVEVPRFWAGNRRAGSMLTAIFSIFVLIGAGAAAKKSLDIYATKTLPVGSGRDQFYTFPPAISPRGPMLNLMLQEFKENTPRAQSLVGIPEGIAVNYLLRVRSPIRELELHPLALGYSGGSQKVLDEFKAHPPEVIFLHYRDMQNYDVRYFGETKASGSDILAWINENYTRQAFSGQSPDTSTGHLVDMYVPKVLKASAQQTASTTTELK